MLFQWDIHIWYVTSLLNLLKKLYFKIKKCRLEISIWYMYSSCLVGSFLQGTWKNTWCWKSGWSFIWYSFWLCPFSWHHIKKESLSWSYQIWEKKKCWISTSFRIFSCHYCGSCWCCMFNGGIILFSIHILMPWGHKRDYDWFLWFFEWPAVTCFSYNWLFCGLILLTIQMGVFHPLLKKYGPSNIFMVSIC